MEQEKPTVDDTQKETPKVPIPFPTPKPVKKDIVITPGTGTMGITGS